MTTRKGAYRRRRQTTLTSIPQSIAEWFAGQRGHSFYAVTPPYIWRLPEYWEAWTQEHPGATMPKGLEMLLKIKPGPMEDTINRGQP